MPAMTDAVLVAQERLDATVGLLTLEAQGLGEGVVPGHFAMLVRPHSPPGDAGRPFAYHRVLSPHRVQFLLKERPDALQSLLQAHAHTVVPLLGPLGRPFSSARGQRLWVVGGGVGVAAFGGLTQAAFAPDHLEMFLGVRDAQDAALVAAMRGGLTQLPQARLHVTADDGSLGPAGSIVDALAARLAQGTKPPDALFACGPWGMLEAVARVAQAAALPCEVSVGVTMRCGVGHCLSCAHVDISGQTRLACVDGPVYPASQLFGAARP